MLDFDIVTASDLISIGIAIGNTSPSFIIAGTHLSKLKLNELLASLSDNNQTKNLSMLIIADRGDNFSELISRYKTERKISVLQEPLDIHQFKKEVENLS
ncbi:hypothetical protein ES705_45817 [subsurface metagenome]